MRSKPWLKKQPSLALAPDGTAFVNDKRPVDDRAFFLFLPVGADQFVANFATDRKVIALPVNRLGFSLSSAFWKPVV